MKSSAMTKEKGGYEIFNFKVKLQNVGIFFSPTVSLSSSPGAIHFNKSWYKQCLLVFHFLGSYIIFITRCFSLKGEENPENLVKIGGVLVEARNLDLMNMKRKCTQRSMGFFE